MLASVIGAFVALVAVGTLRTVSAGREKLDSDITASAQVSFAANMIRRDLGHLYRDSNPDNVKLVGVVEETDYGPRTHLVLHTVNRIKARADEPEGDVYEVEYFLLKDREKSALMRRLWPYPNKDAEPGGVVMPIAENIAVFNISYLSGEEWLAEWPEDMRALPDLVEISLAAALPGQKNPVTETFLVNFPRLAKSQLGSDDSESAEKGSPPRRESR